MLSLPFVKRTRPSSSPAPHSPISRRHLPGHFSLYPNLHLTMYKLTLILFAFFSLVLPILAVPVPAIEETKGRRAALSGSGRVRVIHTFLLMTLTFSACREPGINLALAVVVEPIPNPTLSSLFPRSTARGIAGGCVVHRV